MLRIVPAISGETIAQARNLFRKYPTTTGVEPCLEDFEREVVSLPGLYAPPSGRLLLAIQESPGNSGEAIGCAALRKFDRNLRNEAALRAPRFRGKGAARQLVKALIAEARTIGYQGMSWTRFLPCKKRKNSTGHLDFVKFQLI